MIITDDERKTRYFFDSYTPKLYNYYWAKISKYWLIQKHVYDVFIDRVNI